MLKQKRQVFEFLFVSCDLLVVALAWLVAYWLRFRAAWVPVLKGVPDIGNYLALLIFILPIWLVVFRRLGLYRPMRGVRRSREMWLLINGNALGVVILIALTYLFREKEIEYSRLVFLYFGLVSTFMIAFERLCLRFLLREVRRRGYNLRYMLLVGAGKVAADIASRVRLHHELGIQMVGCLSKEGKEERGPWGMPVLGGYSDLVASLQKLDIDQVVVALPLEDNSYLPNIIGQLKDTLVDVKIVPDLYQFVSLGGAIEEFEGLPVISIQESPMSGVGLMLKRWFDFILAIVLIIIFSPVMLIILLAVKLTSRGPILFLQERVSIDGSPFKIFKFRTMTQDAENDGPGWTVKGDARVTSIGKFLRASSLDELPQLFNVLRGDMSIVGPRPERPVFIEEFRKRVPNYNLRHKVPAGMTGWAQIHGWRGDTSIDKRLEFDLYYIENWSLWLDLKILILTLFRGFSNRNAY